MIYAISLLISCVVVTWTLSYITTQAQINKLKKSQDQWLLAESRRVSEKLATIGSGR